MNETSIYYFDDSSTQTSTKKKKELQGADESWYEIYLDVNWGAYEALIF